MNGQKQDDDATGIFKPDTFEQLQAQTRKDKEDAADRRLLAGTRRLLEMRDGGRKGRVTFYLDGSRKVSGLEVVESV